MFIFANPNPRKLLVDDCVVRGISILNDQPWLKSYDQVAAKGRELYSMPSTNFVWNELLMDQHFRRESIPNTCPHCYTIRDFCMDHPYGEFLVATGTHVVAILNGNYYDTWDSGDEVPIYYYERR